jgi:hypothetical protein
VDIEVTERDQEEQDVRIDMMLSQKQLADRQFRWETIKAVAAFIAATAVLSGFILGLANWLHPAQAPSVVLPPGTVITIPQSGKAP